jgi:hypothetical protein
VAVAEASVRIVADTRQFENDLRREMMDAGADSADVYSDAFRRNLRGVGRDLRNDIRSNLRDISTEVRIDPNTRRFQQAIREQVRRMRATSIDATVDARQLQEQIERAIAGAPAVTITADLDIAALQSEVEVVQAQRPDITFTGDFSTALFLTKLAAVTRLRPTITFALELPKRTTRTFTQAANQLKQLSAPAERLRQSIFPLSRVFGFLSERMANLQLPGTQTYRTMQSLNGILGQIAGTSEDVSLRTRILGFRFVRNIATFALLSKVMSTFNDNTRDVGVGIGNLGNRLGRLTTPFGFINALLPSLGSSIRQFGDDIARSGRSSAALGRVLTEVGNIFDFINSPVSTLIENSRNLSQATRRLADSLQEMADNGSGPTSVAFRQLSTVLRGLDQAVLTPVSRFTSLGGAMELVRERARNLGRAILDPIGSFRRLGVAIAETQAGLDLRARLRQYRIDMTAAARANTTVIGTTRALVAVTARSLVPAFRALAGIAWERVQQRFTISWNAIRNILTNVGKVAIRFGQTMAKVGAIGTVALGSLGPAAASAVIGITSLTAALASFVSTVTGAALALGPATFLLFAAAIKTLTIATGGLTTAWDAAGASAEEFNKKMTVGADIVDKSGTVIGKVTPQLRAVAVEMRGFRTELLGVRDAVQGAFLSQVEGSFSNLSAILPTVRAGMISVATQYGVIAQRSLAFAASSGAISTVSRVFSSLQDIMRGVAAGITPVLNGLNAVAQAGLGSFTGLGSSIESVMTRFGTFLSNAAVSGQVTGWIAGAQAAFAGLGQVISNIASIFRSIGQAATTALGGVGNAIGAVTGQLAAFLQSAQGQQTLVAVFQALSVAAQQLGPLVRALGEALAGIGPTVSSLVASTGPALTALIQGLGDGLEAMGPGIATAFGALSDALRDAAPALGSVGEAFGAILAAVSPLIPPLGRLVNVVLTEASRVVLRLVDALSPLLDAFEPILEVAVDIAAAIIDLISVAIMPLISGIRTLSKIFGVLLESEIVIGLFEGIASAIEMVTSGLKSLIDLIPGIDFDDMPEKLAFPTPDTAAMERGFVRLDENLQQVPSAATEATRGFGTAMSNGISSGYAQGGAAMRTGNADLTRAAGQLGTGVKTQLQQSLEQSIASAIQNALRPVRDNLKKQLDGIKVEGRPQADLRLDLDDFDGGGLSKGLKAELDSAYKAAFDAAKSGNTQLIEQIKRQFANSMPEMRDAVERGLGNGTTAGLKDAMERLKKASGTELSAVQRQFIEDIGRATGTIPQFQFKGGKVVGVREWIKNSLLVQMAQGISGLDVSPLFSGLEPRISQDFQRMWEQAIKNAPAPTATSLPVAQGLEALIFRTLSNAVQSGMSPRNLGFLAPALATWRGSVIAEMNKLGKFPKASTSQIQESISAALQGIPSAIAPGGKLGLSINNAFNNLNTALQQGLSRVGADLTASEKSGLSAAITQLVAQARTAVESGKLPLNEAISQMAIGIGTRLENLGIDPTAAGLNLSTILQEITGQAFDGAAAAVPGQADKLKGSVNQSSLQPGDFQGWGTTLQGGLVSSTDQAFLGAAAAVPGAAAGYRAALGQTASVTPAVWSDILGPQILAGTSTAFNNAALGMPLSTSGYITALGAVPANATGVTSAFYTGTANGVRTATTNAMLQGALAVQTQGALTMGPAFSQLAQLPNTYLPPMSTNMYTQGLNAANQGQAGLAAGIPGINSQLGQLAQSPNTYASPFGTSMFNMVNNGMNRGETAADSGAQATATEIGTVTSQAVNALGNLGFVLYRFFTDAMAQAVSAVSAAAGTIVAILSAISSRISTVNGQITALQNRPIPSVPQAANGGIFSAPTILEVGEAGREVIIPLTRPRRAAELADKSGLTAMLARRGNINAPMTVHMHSNASQSDVLARMFSGQVVNRLRTVM